MLSPGDLHIPGTENGANILKTTGLQTGLSGDQDKNLINKRHSVFPLHGQTTSFLNKWKQTFQTSDKSAWLAGRVTVPQVGRPAAGGHTLISPT